MATKVICPIGQTLQEADLVLAPFTITHNRRQVIDMTTPFEDINLNVLMKRASAQGRWEETA